MTYNCRGGAMKKDGMKDGIKSRSGAPMKGKEKVGKMSKTSVKDIKGKMEKSK
jgi:hypothetical protein